MCTNGLTDTIVVVAQLEAVEAVTLEAADGVGAGAVVADVGMPDALVRVHASLTRGCQLVAVVADTLEATLRVGTVPALADPWPLYALVHI